MDIVWQLSRHVEAAIRAQWPAGPAALVAAVSGGADSMCLLRLLNLLRAPMGFSLSVLHVHHGIRGPAADLDAAFVREQCGLLGLTCHVVAVDAPALAAREGRSLEDAARRLRHRAFSDILAQTGAEAVVLAHHQDDQAETVLLHLLRGAASDGLCGMHAHRGGLFRPLLEVRADSLRDCMRLQGWTFREDESNLDATFRRNALRHRWIPRLRDALGHDPTGPLTRFAAYQQQDQALLWQLAAEAASRCDLDIGREETRYARWRAATFSALPDALARRVALLAWEGVAGDKTGFEAAHVEMLLRLCRDGKAQGRLNLPGGYVAFRHGDRCEIGPAPLAAGRTPAMWAHPVPLPETAGLAVRLEVPEAGGALVVTRLAMEQVSERFPRMRTAQTAYVQLLDSALAPAGIHIRNRRDGDVFHPWHAPGRQKMKKWFIDRKIPAAQRARMPLLAAGNMVLWVPGHRAAGQMTATPPNDAYLFEWEGKTKGEACE
jgi:tRNA(Ile)-lysidine synthase